MARAYTDLIDGADSTVAKVIDEVKRRSAASVVPAAKVSDKRDAGAVEGIAPSMVELEAKAQGLG